MPRIAIPDDTVVQPLITHYTELATHYRQSATNASRIAANMIDHLHRGDPERARHYQQWSDALVQRFLTHAEVCERWADALTKTFATHYAADEHAQHLLHVVPTE
jgi:ABC-type Zn uptake system ZnuABC Zn-binding protein ZnuA